MRLSKLPLALNATILLSAFVASGASAGNDACKLLTPEKFGEIMGYKATVNTRVSTAANCFYKGAGEAGGALMIITEAANARTAAMADSQGSTPQGENGNLGATFRKGAIIFTIGIKGSDPAKVTALAAEAKQNLK